MMRFKSLGGTSTTISVIGQGTGIGGYSSRSFSYEDYARIVRLGIDSGLSFIDTAPAYGDGLSEEAVGKAIEGIREKVVVATKVSPENTYFEGVRRSAEETLRRLNTDYIDLYQVHWSNPKVPTAETMQALARLAKEGKIRHIGVSNFSLKELKQARVMLPQGKIASLQVEYNLFDRSIEDHLLPYCEQEGITVIVYSPLHRGRITTGAKRIEALQAIAARYDKTVAQIALRWLISHRQVVAIPNTTNPERIKENAASADFDLSAEDIEEIGRVCALKAVGVPTQKIRVSAEYNRAVYQTLEEAKENRFNLVPSPIQLAGQIQGGEFLKPVQLVRSKDLRGKYEYDLVEGRIRYWAWVIAYGGQLPIPALVEE